MGNLGAEMFPVRSKKVKPESFNARIVRLVNVKHTGFPLCWIWSLRSMSQGWRLTGQFIYSHSVLSWFCFLSRILSVSLFILYHVRRQLGRRIQIEVNRSLPCYLFASVWGRIWKCALGTMAINDLRASAGNKSMTVTLKSGRVCGQLENACPNLPIVVVLSKQNTTAG